MMFDILLLKMIEGYGVYNVITAYLSRGYMLAIVQPIHIAAH